MEMVEWFVSFVLPAAAALDDDDGSNIPSFHPHCMTRPVVVVVVVVILPDTGGPPVAPPQLLSEVVDPSRVKSSVELVLCDWESTGCGGGGVDDGTKALTVVEEDRGTNDDGVVVIGVLDVVAMAVVVDKLDGKDGRPNVCGGVVTSPFLENLFLLAVVTESMVVCRTQTRVASWLLCWWWLPLPVVVVVVMEMGVRGGVCCCCGCGSTLGATVRFKVIRYGD